MIVNETCRLWMKHFREHFIIHSKAYTFKKYHRLLVITRNTCTICSTFKILAIDTINTMSVFEHYFLIEFEN